MINNIKLLRWLVLYLLQSANDYKGSKVEFTFPGTYWCGPGNFSQNFNDLGYLPKTDECCREHDHCPLYICGDETKYGLINDVPYTRSECNCDLAFYKCLHNVTSTTIDTLTSMLVGNIYFTFLEDRCFQKIPPNVVCDINRNVENCAIPPSNRSSSFVWKTMPPF